MIKSVTKAGIPKIFKETKGMSLTPVAGEVLMHQAKIMSEGIVQQNIGGKQVYSGSTMLTIDLTRFGQQFQVETNRDNLLRHLKTSLFFRLAVLRLARKEAVVRCTKGLLGEVRTELEFKIERDQLLVDIDVLGDVQSNTAEDFGHGDA